MTYIIMLIAIGLLLSLVEAIVPGFGVPGILGAICIVAGCILAFYDGGVLMGLAAIAVSGLAVTLIVVAVSRLAGNKLILHQAVGATVDTDRDDQREALLGQRGRAVTPLRPAGSAEIGGRRIDVTAEDAFVDAGSEIVVVKLGANQIYVSPVSKYDGSE